MLCTDRCTNEDLVHCFLCLQMAALLGGGGLPDTPPVKPSSARQGIAATGRVLNVGVDNQPDEQQLSPNRSFKHLSQVRVFRLCACNHVWGEEQLSQRNARAL
jgi:hypothetical protein